ncbi:pilus assembly protein [Caulobacter segnis]|uniref:TadE family protein n=2 Tax=Caulobacter segnis TaxID=88688 RepID=D5VN06_CAUST|nr:TadE/TadG family type IV pilus assembly protein [Caulobacter segnis]ADG11879.1 TadE family protein [Caulobacter segnis ATCC 21756]AVQ03511.1 pilus assembly protein [Caulobacter segnis]
MAHRFILDRARLRLARAAARFARAERGATAVEFALVSIPFLLLVMAMIELGLVFLVSLSLENAIIDAGRTIRTGEAQGAKVTATAFKTSVCNRMSWLGDRCADALSLDVRTFTDFAGVSASAANATAPNPTAWDPGQPGSIVLVRGYYTWPLVTPLMNTGLQSADGKRTIYAATAFMNEPYEQ